nr:hypothetical protein [Angustibacter aerolatus]
MSLTGLLDALAAGEPVARARELAASGASPATLDLVAASGAWPVVVATLAARAPHGVGRPVLAVTATGREAEDLASALRCFLPGQSVVDFPAWETLPHERLSPRSDTVGRRLAVLRRLAHPVTAQEEPDEVAGPVSVVVAPVRALLQPIVTGLGDLEPVRLRTGDDIALEDAAARLSAAAYTRTDLVERRGEFAVRGGILDVFPRPSSTPCASSSGATPSTRCGGSPSPTSAASSRRPAGCGRRRAASLLLTDDVRERARALANQACPASATCCSRSPRASPSRAWSRSRRPWSTACSRCSTCCPSTRTYWSATPSGCGRGRTTWWPPARSSSPPPGRAPAPDRPRSTSRRCSARRRSARSPRCANTPRPSARRGGPSARSAPTPRSPPATRPTPPRWRSGCARRSRTAATPRPPSPT